MPSSLARNTDEPSTNCRKDVGTNQPDKFKPHCNTHARGMQASNIYARRTSRRDTLPTDDWETLVPHQQPPRHSFRDQRALMFHAVTPEAAHGGRETSTAISPRTTDLGILFKNDVPDNIEGFTDSDRAGDAERRCSTSAYIFMAGGVPSTWSNRKHPTVALSSTEAKYRSLAEGTKEALWLLQQLLQELRLRKADAINIHCDNITTMNIASNPIMHARTKHIEVHHHFVCENFRDLSKFGHRHCPKRIMQHCIV